MSRVEWTRYPGDEIEMVIAIMLLRERPWSAHMRASRGDGGIDVITTRPPGTPIVDQIKSFATGPLSASRKRQISSSLERVRNVLSDEIEEWNLVVPMDPTREQLRWFQSLDAPFETTWLGLTYLEGLAAKYPDVIDYYLHGQRSRVSRHAGDLLELKSFELDIASGKQPDVSTISAAIASAADSINRTDPHYRYEYRVGQAPAPSPSNQHGLVYSQSTQLASGLSVTIDVFARFEQATVIRPIPINISLLPQSEEDEAAIQEHFDFGTQVDVPASIELPEGLPGGLPHPAGPARIRITQHRAPSPPELELRIVDETETTVATLDIEIVDSSHGRAGGRFRATDPTGAVELDGTIRPAPHHASFKYSLRLDRLDGVAVRACLDVIGFTALMRNPHRVALAFRHGGTVATSEPVVGDVFADDQGSLLKLLEDLSVIQECCPTPLIWDTAEGLEEQQDIRDYAALLRGEELEARWTEISIEMTADGRAAIEEMPDPSAIVQEQEMGLRLFGSEFRIGTERLWFESASPTIGDTHPDGSFDVMFTPANSNRFRRTLKRI